MNPNEPKIRKPTQYASEHPVKVFPWASEAILPQ